MASIQDEGILIAQHGTGNSTVRCFLRPDKANRHGLITGATGTGKTITLQTLAEGFSSIGVPVFMADVKGDLSGICAPGDPAAKVSDKLSQRAIDIGIGAKSREKIARGLSVLLADSYTLYLMTHNFHWNVTGPEFASLHQQFGGFPLAAHLVELDGLANG